MDAEPHQVEVFSHTAQLGNPRCTVQGLGDTQCSREALGQAVPIGGDVVVDPAGVRHSVGPQVAVTGDEDGLIDPVAVHRCQPAVELDGGRIVARCSVGELEALGFE